MLYSYSAVSGSVYRGSQLPDVGALPGVCSSEFWLAMGALLAGAVALLATIAAVAVQIIPWYGADLSLRQKMSYALRHVSFYGQLFVFSYWAFSLLLSIINQLSLIPNIVVGHTVLSLGSPFTQPDPLAVLSFANFLLYLARLMRRRAQDRETKKSAPMGEG